MANYTTSTARFNFLGHCSLWAALAGVILFGPPVLAAPGQIFPPLSEGALSRIEAALPAQCSVAPKQPRRLLVFYRTEGFVHQSIPYGNHALVRLGETTGAYTAVVSEDMAMFAPEMLATFDAVIFNNTSRLAFANPVHRAALLEFVARGGGMAGLHAGSDNFPDWPEAQALLGGVFHNHPWRHGDTVAIKLDEPEHPLVAAFGGRGFWLREEIYQIKGDYSRERQRVVLSLDMSKPQNARDQGIIRTDNDFPIAWIKAPPTGGRVFYSSLGHNPDIFFQPEILRHFLDGIQFALGDYPMDAVPSARLARPPTPALAPPEPLPLQDRPQP